MNVPEAPVRERAFDVDSVPTGVETGPFRTRFLLANGDTSLPETPRFGVDPDEPHRRAAVDHPVDRHESPARDDGGVVEA